LEVAHPGHRNIIRYNNSSASVLLLAIVQDLAKQPNDERASKGGVQGNRLYTGTRCSRFGKLKREDSCHLRKIDGTPGYCLCCFSVLINPAANSEQQEVPDSSCDSWFCQRTEDNT
jgi:hypothetical protein